jgi:hypothetical protein
VHGDVNARDIQESERESHVGSRHVRVFVSAGPSSGNTHVEGHAAGNEHIADTSGAVQRRRRRLQRDARLGNGTR